MYNSRVLNLSLSNLWSIEILNEQKYPFGISSSDWYPNLNSDPALRPNKLPVANFLTSAYFYRLV